MSELQQYRPHAELTPFTLANLPFEVGLWARHGGPVVVAPDLGGFPETISHHDNGTS